MLGRRISLAMTLALVVSAARGQDVPKITFSHVLADFLGPVRIAEPRLALAEWGTGEVVVAQARDVRFFNRSGMQEFRFRTPTELGIIYDTAPQPGGELLTLAYALETGGGTRPYVITRHNYRGVPIGEVIPSGLPPRFAALGPNRMLSQQDRLILASTAQLLAVALDGEGRFVAGYDLGEILEIDPEKREITDITAISLDRDGNLLITSAQLFRAFVVSPDGELLAVWGEAGSAEGTFNLVSGIARDARGRYFVADQLRGTISVFDDKLRFLLQFGEKRTPQGRLGIPKELMFDDLGRLYVTQVGERGVWVYDVRD